MKAIIVMVFYSLLRVDCPAGSTDNSCFDIEARDTIRKEFKTIGAAKGFVTKAKNSSETITAGGKILLNMADGFVEYLRIDTIK